MPFRIDEGLARAAQGWGLDRNRLESEAERIAAEFPDAEDQKAKLVAWIEEQIGDRLSVPALASTLAGYAVDVFRGLAGSDPKAHLGNV